MLLLFFESYEMYIVISLLLCGDELTLKWKISFFMTEIRQLFSVYSYFGIYLPQHLLAYMIYSIITAL